MKYQQFQHCFLELLYRNWLELELTSFNSLEGLLQKIYHVFIDGSSETLQVREIFDNSIQ